jgi:PleD family two-component response regulator
MMGSDQATVTISIGCATHGEHISFANIADFINAADQALYTAKLRGRNRTVPYDRQIPDALAARQR